MTDDALVIRHVRFCECGKLAGHDSICKPGRTPAGLDPDREVQRVDREWEDQHAERRNDRHARRQPGFRAERILARSQLSTAELHTLAAVRAAKLSPVSAGNIAPSHGAAGHPSVNLALQAQGVQLSTDPRWRGTDELERRSLLRKHELLDEYEGLGVAQAEREITGEDKDAEIVAPHNEHLSAAEFSRQFPGYGTPSTVSRKRRWYATGHCTFNGLPPRSGCRCPTCRGAIT